MASEPGPVPEELPQSKSEGLSRMMGNNYIKLEALRSHADDEIIVSQTQSKILLRNLFRTGISTISYIRNMFPEEDFGDMFFNKMQMKALKPTENSPANALITWLERGKYKSQRICFAVGPDLQSCHCTAIHQLHLHAALQAHSTPFRKDIWRRCRSVSSQV